jgi:cytochrome c2
LYQKIIAYLFVWICLVSSANADQMKQGKAVFEGAGMCASCHVLKAAGAVGDVGPSFDVLKELFPKVLELCQLLETMEY